MDRSSFLTDTGKILKVNFENGFSKKIGIGAADTAKDVVERVAEQSGFVRRDLYQLRIEINNGSTASRPPAAKARRQSWRPPESRWILPDQQMMVLPEMQQPLPECWISIRFVPNLAHLAKLREVDGLSYSYLFDQTVRWVQFGVAPKAVDETCGVRLAALVAQRRWARENQSAGAGKRKVPNLAVIDKELGLENLFPLEMRERIRKDKQKVKKKMIAFLKRHLTTPVDELQNLYLKLAAEGKLLGGSQFALVETRTGLHMTVSVDGDGGIYKNSIDGRTTFLGGINQVISVKTEASKSATIASARSSMTLKMHGGRPNEPPINWMFLGDPAAVMDMANVLDSFYSILVNPRRSIHVSKKTRKVKSAPATERPCPAYDGVHQVMHVDWNYRPPMQGPNRKAWSRERFPLVLPAFEPALANVGRHSDHRTATDSMVSWNAGAPGSLRTASADSLDSPVAYTVPQARPPEYEAPHANMSRTSSASSLYAMPGGDAVASDLPQMIVDISNLGQLSDDGDAVSIGSRGSRSWQPPSGLPPIHGGDTLTGGQADDGYIQIGDTSPAPAVDPWPTAVALRSPRGRDDTKLAHNCSWVSATSSTMSGFGDADGFDLDSHVGDEAAAPPIQPHDRLFSGSAPFTGIPPPLFGRPTPKKSSASSYGGFLDGLQTPLQSPPPPPAGRQSSAPPIPPRGPRLAPQVFDDHDEHDLAFSSNEEELTESIEALNEQLQHVSTGIHSDGDGEPNMPRVERVALMTEMWYCTKMMVTSMWLLAEKSMVGEPVVERQSDAVDACSMLTELLRVTHQLSPSFGQNKEMLFVVKAMSIKFLMVIRAIVQAPTAAAVAPAAVTKAMAPFVNSAAITMRLLLATDRRQKTS